MKIKFAFLLIATGLALAGCDKYRNGPTLTEPAEIYETCFVPAGHGMTIGSVGFTSEGDATFHPPQSVTIPAVYAVVFKCQHGKFVIDGARGERLYRRFSRGDRVIVNYCEEWIVHDDGTHDVRGLHFLDAIPDHAGQVEGEAR